MTVRMTARDLGRSSTVAFESADVEMDITDPDARADLLRRVARRNGRRANDIELELLCLKTREHHTVRV